MGRTVLECDGGDAAIVHDDVVYDLLEEAVRDGGVNGSDVLLVVDVAVFDQLVRHDVVNECPIGCRHSLSDEVVGIDRVTVKLLKSLKTEQLGEVKDTLLDIAADGKITEDEKPALQEVLTYLDDLAKTVSELKTIGEMALNEDGDAHGSK